MARIFQLAESAFNRLIFERGVDRIPNGQPGESYEVGRRRIPVSALPVVAHTLAVSLDELFGQSKPASRGKRGPAPQWQQQIEAVSLLPKSQQQFVARMIETVLAQQQR